MKRHSANRSSLVIAIIFLTLCMLFPIWQNARSQALRKSISEKQVYMISMTENKMSLTSQISRKTSPEYLMAMAKENNISFLQISSTSSSTVATNF